MSRLFAFLTNHVAPEFRLKVFLLSTTFFFMTFCQAIWRPLKMSAFSKMIGPEMIPVAKIYGLFFVIPLIILYSCFVDCLRRHHLLYIFTIGYGCIGIMFYFLFSDPACGLANSVRDSGRALGWAFYFFMEGFDAFFSTTFWSFANSISRPKDARSYFGLLVTGSKIGGVLSASLSYLLVTYAPFNEVTLLTSTFLSGSFALLCAAGAIYLLIKHVPEDRMHGYESVYVLERSQEKKRKGLSDFLKNFITGPRIIFQNFYVMGIFATIIFYEMIIVIVEYIVTLRADKTCETVGQMSGFYFGYYFWMNFIGLIVTLFGTSMIFNFFGLRRALFIFPTILLFSLLYAYFNLGDLRVLYVVFVGLRSLHYTINTPTREVLYIPTTKDVKFKAKAWVDAFGSRFAKTAGSCFNRTVGSFSPSLVASCGISLGISLSATWLLIVYFLGYRMEQAIDTKSVIGGDDQDYHKTGGKNRGCAAA